MIQTTEHDPGGKTRLKLQADVRGTASFSECGKYRYALLRNWGDPDSTYILWIGQNPSEATSDIDDPTVRREINFSRAMGYTSYAKCNIMDYRATNPKALMTVQPRSDENISHIVYLARGAARIIVAWGALPKPLRRYADEVVLALAGYQLYCMGTTQDKSPRHPLYLPNNAECVPWP